MEPGVITVEEAAWTITAIIGVGVIPTALEIMDDVTIRCVENFLRIGLPLDVETIAHLALTSVCQGQELLAPTANN